MQQLLTPQQFAHQPMLDRDPPSIRRHEVSASGDADIRFGRFRVLPRARQLLVDGQSVELGSRAFDPTWSTPASAERSADHHRLLRCARLVPHRSPLSHSAARVSGLAARRPQGMLSSRG